MRGGVTPGRINLDNQQKHPADGTITVDVLGRILTPASYKDADTRVLAIKDGKVICSVPVWVLIPRAIGRPHQEPSGSVRGENVCLDKNSSPAYWGSLAPNQVVLETCWDQWLTMRVVDQFGTSLISLYDGQPVKEIVDGQGSWLSINQSISGGTYLDPVGVFQFKNDSTTPYIVLRNSTEAQNWASAPLATFPVGDVWASVKVQVAGHEVGRVGTKGNIIWPGIAIPRRDIITTAPDNVEIVWP